MKEVLQQRQQAFLASCLKYLRYVLNDHFVLVLLVFLGFVLLQYRNLLEHFPTNPWPLVLLLVSLSAFLVWIGDVATYLEEADQVFCLPKEAEVVVWVEQAFKRSFLLWTAVQTGLQCFLAPLYLKLGLPIWGMAVYVAFLALVKYMWWQKRQVAFLSQGSFTWGAAIAREQARQQRILRFFSLFTAVKGIHGRVSRRSYLDRLLMGLPRKHQQTWAYLYVRSFLRAGDWLGLSLRLLGLSLACLFAIEESWLAVGFGILLDFLLVFQLFGLYKAYDYQYLTRLYPLELVAKKRGFQMVVGRLIYLVGGFQMLLGLMWLPEKEMLLLLLAFVLFLGQVYLPVKSSKMD